MQRSSHASLTEIVRTASALPIERRFAWLRQTCGSDQALYREVMAAFKLEISHAEWWGGDPTSRPVPAHPTIGLQIGRYLVTAKIGSGGISDVLLGTPRDESGSSVAIKIIRRANASQQLHSRLKIERQILGALNHPNIARLLDGGSTSEGMPYLVMEYLQGQPIDTYCNSNCLDLRSRLRLFQSVCRAVQAAHHLSIVHRDLKPSNVLVTAEGVPKLVDFGIAKVLEERSVDLTTMVVTHADVRVLTPDYASPEQIRGDAITPASDIYSLGVLLYELLSGANPRHVNKATPGTHPQAAYPMTPPATPPTLNQQVANAINDAAPHWLKELCRQRSTQPATLDRELSELSPLVLKALARQPHRRYDSAESFAASIDRYLGRGGTPAPIAGETTPSERAGAHRNHRSIIVAVTLLLLIAITFAAHRIF